MYAQSLTSLWWQKTSFHKIPNLSGNNRTCGYQEFVHYYRQALDYVSELDAEQIRQKMSWLENMLLWYSPRADHNLHSDYEFMALKDIVVLRQFFDENKGNIDCHSEACPHLICVHALFDAIAYGAWYSEDDEWDDFLFQFIDETFDPSLYELQAQNDAVLQLICMFDLAKSNSMFYL